jgi:hypothetical protein
MERSDLTLKNLKYSAHLSEETDAFSASIYLRGKRVGNVQNIGQGGPNEYHWLDREAGREIEAWASEQDTEYEFEKLDQILGSIANEVEELRWLKRNSKRNTLFMLKGEEKKGYRTVKAPYSPEVEAFIKKKYGEQVKTIINPATL